MTFLLSYVYKLIFLKFDKQIVVNKVKVVVVCLILLQSCYASTRLASRGTIVSSCPFVPPSVHLLPNLGTRYFENEWADFDEN